MEKGIKFCKNPINYMGNKYRLLSQLEKLLPKNIDNFYDLFGGTGCVGINAKCNKIYYNEINTNVVDLFNLFIKNSASNIIETVENIIKQYDLNLKNTDSRHTILTKEQVKYYNDNYLRLRKDYNTDKNIFKLLVLTF